MLIFRYIRKHIFAFLSAAILTAIAHGMMSGQAIFQQILVDLVVDGEMTLFVRTLVYLGVFSIAMFICYFASGYLTEKSVEKFLTSIRNDIYKGVMKRNRSDYESKDTAQYISNIQNDTESIAAQLRNVVGYVLGTVISTVVILVIMLVYSIPLALVTIGATLIGLVIPIIFSRPMAKRQLEISTKAEQFTVEKREIFEGREVISSLNLFESFFAKFNVKNRNLTRARFHFGKLTMATQSFAITNTNITRIVILAVAGFMVLSSSITLGVLVLFVSSSAAFSANFNLIMQLLPFLKSIFPIADKLEELIDYQDSTFTGNQMPSFDKEITAKNLSFAYNEDMPILDGMDFIIRKNEKVAIIGPSGCGKSTLIKLLKGEYFGYSGEIMYDGVELKQLKISELHKLITTVHQNVYIFNDTIRNNICLHENFTENDLTNALSRSGVDKFLSEIPNGLDGDCGEKGSNLSGGQRQRIAIARAIIRGVKFIILDEGVSAIDVKTANEIEQELLNIKDLTLVSITHRIQDGILGSYDRVVEIKGINGSAISQYEASEKS